MLYIRSGIWRRYLRKRVDLCSASFKFFNSKKGEKLLNVLNILSNEFFLVWLMQKFFLQDFYYLFDLGFLWFLNCGLVNKPCDEGCNSFCMGQLIQNIHIHITRLSVYDDVAELCGIVVSSATPCSMCFMLMEIREKCIVLFIS